jgi:hypothetical protein
MNCKIFLTLPVAIILFSCSGGFSKGVKKDFTTGLSASYNGFSLEDIYLTSTDNKRLSSNALSLGSPISIMANGVEHFTEKDGKVFPGCTIILSDKAGKEILNLPDAFSEMKEGTTKQEATVLRAQLNTGDPMVKGETYHLKARFFDKNNKENEIIATVDLLMK